MKEKGVRILLADALLFAALLAADLVTKAAAAAALAASPKVLINGVLELRYLENHGAAFGILQDARWLFVVLAAAFVAVGAYVYFSVPRTRRFLLLRVCITMLAAGAVGNCIDRVAFGHVRDFIYFSLIDFPIFNVADIYVTCGAAFLAIIVLFVYKDGEISQHLKR